MSKDLEYYRALPYTLRVDRFVEDEDGEVYYRAGFVQLPQVAGIHKDRLLAINLAKELFDSFVEAQIAWGEEIPEPSAPRSRKRGGLFRLDLKRIGGRGEREGLKVKQSEEPSPTAANSNFAMSI